MQNTRIRDIIPGNLNFPGTIYSLPIVESYTYLQFVFSFRQTTFSKFIPEIWEALYKDTKVKTNKNTIQSIILFS